MEWRKTIFKENCPWTTPYLLCSMCIGFAQDFTVFHEVPLMRTSFWFHCYVINMHCVSASFGNKPTNKLIISRLSFVT